ncbi:hypothetical protein FHS15_000151 [Paenibacillus castaneae]|uniref:X2-like carbohydrate binding domain-containing protein n=1 Tax=Paenibacillus castaneae TaxID=474957 RepID=UPI000C9AADEF|nr:X2-like carbohydrate binding domain-containing protein [Paenibacillus castaneae]NIK75053.1 hypothetical protein [Paenibacillus castaneae]
MRRAMRKMMAIVMASALLFNLFSMVNPGIAEVSGAPSEKWIKKSSISLSSIAYGNNMYVALTSGNDPKIVTSTDLVNWVEQKQIDNQTKPLNTVKFLNGQFVIGANFFNNSQIGSTFLFSPDGVHWTGQTIVKPPQYSISSITYGKGIYVASSFFGEMASSTDGVTWSTPVKALSQIAEVRFINGHFVAVGYYETMPGMMMGNNAIVTSTDGLTWNRKLLSSNRMGGLNSVASNGDKVIVASFIEALRFSASAMDQSTMSVESINSLTNGYIKKLTYASFDGGLFVAVGINGGILTSADTVDWTSESISGATTDFLDVIEAGRSVVAVGAIGVYQRLGQIQDSVLTPNIGSFDKKTSAQSDVTTTLTLNGNTLSGITQGGQALDPDTDYTVTGNSVTIKKAYLAGLPVGTATLTFQFSGGADQTLVITVVDTTPNNSVISPVAANFDKKTSAQSEVTTTLTLNGNTLSSITQGGQALDPDTDYTITGSTLTIKKAFLAGLPVGTATLTFQFSGGADQTLVITVVDTTPNNSVISPVTASFDKKTSAQSDVTTMLTLNGNTLSIIAQGGQALDPDTDYTVTGNSVTIKKAYLAGLPVGTATLTFQFSGGADQTLVITVVNTTPNNSTISPVAANFDKKTSAQSDVTTTLTLNGNTLSSITQGGQALDPDTDYTVTGSIVTIKKAYLAGLPVGTATLTFQFGGGADQTLVITISDTTPNNSTISPVAANFDKKTSAQLYVTTTLTLNGNTLSRITHGGQALDPDTDYTVTGSTVTIKKAYLAGLPVGTATLTFQFSGGADQTLVITVVDTTPNNSTISPAAANFDKKTSAQSDVTTTLTLNGNTLSSIKQGGQALDPDTDYTVIGNSVTIKKAYLAGLPVGTATLTFQFSGGADQTLVITISDTTPNNSTISPVTASFDKKTSAQSDVTTTLTLNGNTLSRITQGGQALDPDTDYTVTGNSVTIKKAYLTRVPVGTATLTFQFSGGADQMLVITVVDTTPNNSTISPAAANFDKKTSAQSDVTTMLTLNGNTLSIIKQGGQALDSDTDYTVTGNSVTIKKAYLAGLPVGTATLTFQFSGGADQTLVITINDTTPNNSTISPAAVNFDKNTSAQSDVTTTLTLNGNNTLSRITQGGQALVLNADYSVTGSTVTIKKAYLAGLPVGTATLTFQFSGGADQTLVITVVDTTPNNSTISPAAANFDKKTSAQSDVTTMLTLNGNTVSRITQGGQALDPDTDYTITGSILTIKKAYLAELPVGTVTLTFQFSDGADQTLVITISETTPNNSTISPLAANFDKKTSTQSDVTTTLTLNGNTLSGITQGDQTLTLDTDYTVTGSTVTIKKAYLAGLPVGTATLKFQFSGGADQTLVITVVDTTIISPPIINEPQPTEPNNSADIYVNGKVVSAGTVTQSTRNNQSVITIAVDQAKLADRLAKEGQSPVITILMNSKSDIIVGELNGNMVKAMENKQATLELKTDKASYFLPAIQIDIDGIQKQLGGSIALQDISIHIEIDKPAPAMTSVVENAARNGAFTILVPPVDFKVSASYGERVVEVTQFSTYVKRQIALSDEIVHSGITTGIVVDPDGSVRHVPTQVTLIDGQYFAQMNSLTNSTYAVVWHPIEFADVASHWAKDAINDMGSRMIVDGRGNGNFDPSLDMTRAEFATILVRALGLRPIAEKAPFSDVNQSDWYNQAIGTAHAYHLISGFEDGTFRPNEKLTREQAMVMISKAMILTQLKERLPMKDLDELLRSFGLVNMSNWAKQGIADCIQAGIVVGKSNSDLAAQASITRAEVAVMMKRLLEKSDLI